MAYNLERNQEYFSKYLPENITWEQMDDLVERAITSVSMLQIFGELYPSPWVKKTSVQHYLRDQGMHHESAVFCTTISWQRLLNASRVIRAQSSGIGTPTVRPKITK